MFSLVSSCSSGAGLWWAGPSPFPSQNAQLSLLCCLFLGFASVCCCCCVLFVIFLIVFAFVHLIPVVDIVSFVLVSIDLVLVFVLVLVAVALAVVVVAAAAVVVVVVVVLVLVLVLVILLVGGTAVLFNIVFVKKPTDDKTRYTTEFVVSPITASTQTIELPPFVPST